MLYTIYVLYLKFNNFKNIFLILYAIYKIVIFPIKMHLRNFHLIKAFACFIRKFFISNLKLPACQPAYSLNALSLSIFDYLVRLFPIFFFFSF